MKEEVVDSLFVTWLTLLGIAYLSLALPHCALNSPTFVPLLGEMINHLRPLMPHLIQEQALLVVLMGKKFPRIPCPILYYGFNWGQSCCFHVVLELASIPPTPALILVQSGLLLRCLFFFVQFIQLKGNSSQVGCFLLSGFEFALSNSVSNKGIRCISYLSQTSGGFVHSSFCASDLDSSLPNP